MRRFLLTWTAMVVSILSAHAQVLRFPDASPSANVAQTIGIATVSIDYNRPAVKGRPIWGSLVPYGLSKGVPWGSGVDFPWRAGANENTVITFSHDVKIEGQSLPAGSYGLHILPQADEMTLIFSKNFASWGSFYYDPKEDALRVTVKPAVCEFHENLLYGFDQITNSAAVAYLAWEKMKIPFRVEFDTKSIQTQSLREEMRGRASFSAQNVAQAANWCLANSVMLDEALMWTDRSILLGAGTNVRLVKSALLDALGRKDESVKLRQATLDAATEADINAYGYTLLGARKTAEAIDVFQLNVKKFPKSWNVYDSLAEAQLAAGNSKDAVANYRKAQGLTTDDSQKKRIQGILDGIK